MNNVNILMQLKEDRQEHLLKRKNEEINLAHPF